MSPWWILALQIFGWACFVLAVLLVALATPAGLILRSEIREYLTRRVKEVLGLEEE